MDIAHPELASLSDMRDALDLGAVSARELIAAHLARIDALDATHNAVLLINPDAMAIADALDEERAAGAVRGSLHGIPILVKDNLDSADSMPTTAGSLALAGSHEMRAETA